MYFLILCILSSTGIFIVFKFIDRLNIPPFPVIVINYLVATILGFLIHNGRQDLHGILQMDWLPISSLIGIMFIIMFFIVAISTRKAGISVTTVASKMSVIFPIVFSLILDTSDRLTPLKAAAIFCTICGVALTVYKPRRGNIDLAVIYIPVLLFLGMGVVDSMVKLAQHRFVNDADTALFSAVLFLNAFISGLIVLAFSRKKHRYFLEPKTWGWGILLGAVNFGSIYFLVRALNYTSAAGTGTDSSILFGMNNIGIVALGVFLGLWLFRERLRIWNWMGIILSAIAIILFTMG